MSSYVDHLRAWCARWHRGECSAHEAAGLLNALQEGAGAMHSHATELRKLRNGRENAPLEAAIETAAREHDEVAGLYNEILRTDRERAKTRLASADWSQLPVATSDWAYVAPGEDGIFAVREKCCSCGAEHLMDYKFANGLLWLRTFQDQTMKGKLK